MKKLTRMGVIVVIVGVSLLLTTFYRGSNQEGINRFQWLGTPSEGFVFDDRFLLPPRTCQIHLNSSSEVDVYILDEEGIRLWEEKETLEPIWNSSGAKQHTGTFDVNKRGEYAQLVFNIHNATTSIQETFRFSGIEKDLVVASVAITAIGLVTVAASVLLKKFRVRH
ncbi:MAG: hypothetical protein CW716_00260 [Candidatus Bathyarchaeum sp.]|nr:MAG: hypothetical protein CW716_00260 [Candidatus Bathyarchaeum sp.]